MELLGALLVAEFGGVSLVFAGCGFGASVAMLLMSAEGHMWVSSVYIHVHVAHVGLHQRAGGV